MAVEIKHIEYYLPAGILTNQMLKEKHPDWDVDKVESKSGVRNRHIASKNETALDLAIQATQKFFDNSGIDKSRVQGIIFCTQSPDFIMPSNAFLLQKYFELSHQLLAFDYNLACSGYVYGLAIARGLIETRVVDNVLLINADTYSKFIGENDRSTKVLFGDAAAVSFIQRTENSDSNIIDVILESSGKDFDSFYIPAGGVRNPISEITKEETADMSGNVRSMENIHMNGFGVWKFISQTVPKQILHLLKRNNLALEQIDLFVFHQASKLTLDSLVKALKLSDEKVFINIAQIGNTVSASIPIALKDAVEAGRIKRGDTILISGFGVGLSWGSAIVRY